MPDGQWVGWGSCGLVVQPARHVIELIVDVSDALSDSNADIQLVIADWNQQERKFLSQSPIVSIRVFINRKSNRRKCSIRVFV